MDRSLFIKAQLVTKNQPVFFLGTLGNKNFVHLG